MKSLILQLICSYSYYLHNCIGRDAFILESCFRNSVYSTLAEPFSKANEVAVLQYLQKYCLDSISIMDSVSSMDEDRLLLASKALVDNRALLARLRMQVGNLCMVVTIDVTLSFDVFILHRRERLC